MDSGGSVIRQKPLLQMRNITKIFPENGVAANRSVHFELNDGEIHALVGENGSGKSTLMHILAGMLPPDEGEIQFRGASRRFRSPFDAIGHGIGMVHQHAQYVREFSVLENIILGREPLNIWGGVDKKKAIRRVEELMKSYHLYVDLQQPAYRLSVEGIQKMALLSLLYEGVEILILDEPTILFEENQEDLLFSVLQRLRKEGHSIIFITHKLKEALAYSDRISVMRAGELVATYMTPDLDREMLTNLMVGGQAIIRPPAAGPADTREERQTSEGKGKETPPSEAKSDKIILELKNASYRGARFPLLENVSFDVKAGETVAVTGIRENGLETLEQILAGFIRPDKGDIYYKGDSISGLSIGELRKKQIAYIPTERLVRGASLDSSVAENMIILNYRNFHSWGNLKREEIDHFAHHLKHQFDIKASTGDRLSGLSGGNIQKVIISRELYHSPDLLIFSEPSWGLDLAGRRFVMQKIDELTGFGSAVLIITSDIEEALESADRIVVMYRGVVSGIVSSRSSDKNEIGRLMLGIESHAQ